MKEIEERVEVLTALNRAVEDGPSGAEGRIEGD